MFKRQDLLEKTLDFSSWCQNQNFRRCSFFLLQFWVVEMEKEIKWIRSVASQFPRKRNLKIIKRQEIWGPSKPQLLDGGLVGLSRPFWSSSRVSHTNDQQFRIFGCTQTKSGFLGVRCRLPIQKEEKRGAEGEDEEVSIIPVVGFIFQMD